MQVGLAVPWVFEGRADVDKKEIGVVALGSPANPFLSAEYAEAQRALRLQNMPMNPDSERWARVPAY